MSSPRLSVRKRERLAEVTEELKSCCPARSSRRRVLAHLAGKRDRFVGPAAKRAVKFCIVGGGADVQYRHPIEGEAEHLVERRTRVPTAVTSSDGGGQVHLPGHFYPCPNAQAREQEFIQQPCANQRWVKGRNIAEIVVVEIQLHARDAAARAT